MVNMMKSRAVLLAVLAGVLAFLFCIVDPARAQTATVGGRIIDPAGEVAGDVKITSLNTLTGQTREDVTDNTGQFRFSNLVPGNYALTIEKAGFKTIHVNDLLLSVNQAFSFEAQLQVADAVTSTEVKASELPLIELENAQISNLVDSKRITDLPLITRDPYQLILLSPGVIQSNSSLGGFSTNGTSERNNNFLLDGVDNNDADVPGIPGGLNALNPDSTQEFRVITNNFAAEYGRNDGAVIQILTQSGTNELHGSAYWFGRYNALGARDFFNPASGGPQDPYVRNDFGGSAGGPIIKDKTFWFGNYEGQRFITTLTNAATVPTAEYKTGQFTVIGQPINVNCISGSNCNNNQQLALDPTVQTILALYPTPPASAPDVFPGLSKLLFFPSASRLQNDSFTIKVDHNLSKKHLLTGRYSFLQASDPNPFHDDVLPGGLGAVSLYQRTQSAMAGLTSTFSERLVNEFRFGANRNDAQFNCNGLNAFNSLGFVDQFGRGADFGMPFGPPSGASSVTVFGCGNLVDSDAQDRFTGTYQTTDSVSYTKGHHYLKFGGEFRDVYSNSFDNFNTRSYFDLNSYTANGGSVEFLNNLPANSPLFTDTTGALAATENAVAGLLGYVNFQTQSQYFDRNQARTASDLRGLRQREWAGFAQDTWKMLPNLTTTYGLRWEYYGVPFEANNNLTTLFGDPSAAVDSFMFTPVGPGTGHTLYSNQFTNFEPRIGVAWDPFKRGKTSVRLGYGIFHDRAYGNLIGNLRDNPPFAQTAAGVPNAALSTLSIADTLPTSNTIFNGAQFSATLIDPNFKTPYSQNWNVGVQQQIAPNLVLEVNYVGVKGTRLTRVVDGNPPQPALVNQLLAYCVPGNAFNCDASTLQFNNLWTGAEAGVLPMDAVNNNAFVYFGYPGAVLFKSIGSSIYHGLQVNLQKRLSQGFQLQAAYTFSHAIDNVNDPIAPAAGNGSFPVNSFDLKAERGNSDFDIRHRAVVNFIYEPNFGRGRGHLSEGVVGRVLEGWSVTGIVSAQTGHPFDVFTPNQDSDHTGLPSRPTVLSTPNQPPGTDKTFTGPYAGAFELTPFGATSNVGKNEFYGPNYVNVDSAVLKNTGLTEKATLQFRLEAYNLFNHAQFAQPGNLLGNGLFGQSTATITRPDGTTSARQLQVALKLLF